MSRKLFNPCGKGITLFDLTQYNAPVGHTQQPPTKKRIAALSPCASGGSTGRKLGAGKTPGSGSLVCDSCGKFVKWLSASQAKAIANQLNLMQEVR